MKKKHGHTGHHVHIEKAHGHVADPTPKAGKKLNAGKLFMPTHGAKDSMAHGMHHAANAHHGMSEGMAPSGEYGTVSSSKSHLGNNECCEGDMGGEDHSGGESSEG